MGRGQKPQIGLITKDPVMPVPPNQGKGGGDIGVGTTNPDGRFHIHNNSAGSVTANGDANELVIEP